MFTNSGARYICALDGTDIYVHPFNAADFFFIFNPSKKKVLVNSCLADG
jgi:hypothetical protein